MVGRKLKEELSKYLWLGDFKLLRPTKHELDLLDYNAVREYFYYHKPSIIYMLAGYNGGLSFNKKYPSDIFNKSVVMNLNTIDAATQIDKPVIVFPATVCSMDSSSDYFTEEDFLTGSPHESVACHGFAKRAIHQAGMFAKKQFGIDFRTVVAANSFGEGDRFNERGKVVSSMIARMYQAKVDGDKEFIVYGDGSVQREFLYSGDFANALILAGSSYNKEEILCVTSEEEVSIGELAEKIKGLLGYKGQLVFTGPEDNGQLRRRMSTKRMDNNIIMEFTPFNVALERTVKWFLENEVGHDSL